MVELCGLPQSSTPSAAGMTGALNWWMKRRWKCPPERCSRRDYRQCGYRVKQLPSAERCRTGEDGNGLPAASSAGAVASPPACRTSRWRSSLCLLSGPKVDRVAVRPIPAGAGALPEGRTGEARQRGAGPQQACNSLGCGNEVGIRYLNFTRLLTSRSSPSSAHGACRI